MIISPGGAAYSTFKRPARREGAKAFLIGGGIALLAAAAFMIRGGDMLGSAITILEETDIIGGSLDRSGNPEDGYVLRGGRMIESKYLCTFGLFDSISTPDGANVVQVTPLRRWPQRNRASLWFDRASYPHDRAARIGA